MAEPKLLIEIGTRQVAILTLNRPETGNACDPETLDLFFAALTRVSTDSAVRVIILRGAGRHFCSGLDVSAAQPPKSVAREGSEPSATFLDVCRLLEAVPKPTIAVVHGGCVGGGVAVAACCDIVLASTESFFAVPEVRLGIAPGTLALVFIRAMGHRSLRRYLLSGERFTAERARELELVHEVRSPMDIEAALAELIDALLLGGPVALASAKKTLTKYATLPLTGPLFAELEANFEHHAKSAEVIEGKAAFREKRRPVWYPPQNIV